MDISFVLLGLFSATGMLLLSRSLPRGAHRTSIRIIAVLFGVGGVLVGLFPENTVQLMHALGAFLNIGLGNVLLIMIGARSPEPGARSPEPGAVCTVFPCGWDGWS